MSNYDVRSFLSITFKSNKRRLDGQDHRSSKNVDLTTLVKETHMTWRCPKGISFSLKKDVTMGRDPVLDKRITDGTITEFFDCDSVYVADPEVPKEYLENSEEDYFLIEVIPMTYKAPEKCDLSNWIDSYISDDTYIKDIMLPGTHDSASISRWGRLSAWACQHSSIEEQLNSGVRLLDIRLAMRGTPDNLTIYTCHGNFGFNRELNIYQSWQSVLDTCKAFLERNRGEFIVMLVKIDDWGKMEASAATIIPQIDKILKQTWICQFNDDIKGEVKGKLVYIDRYNPEGGERHWCNKWANNLFFSFMLNLPENRTLRVCIQDVYETTPWDKRYQIKKAIHEKYKYEVKEKKNVLLLNYSSMILMKTAGICKFCMTDYVIDYFGTRIIEKGQKENLGWFLFDFATEKYKIRMRNGRTANINAIECVVDANKGLHKYNNYSVCSKEEL